MALIPASISENGKVSLATSSVVGVAASITELGIASLSVSRRVLLSALVNEKAEASLFGSAGFSQHVSLTARGVASTKARLATGVALRSSAKASDGLRVLTGILMAERAIATLEQKAQATYHRAIITRGQVFDVLSRPGIAVFLFSLGVTKDDMMGAYRAVAEQRDDATMTDTLGQRLLLTVIHDETVEISDDLSLRAVWHGYLEDKADFILDLVSPGGDVTTWAMNTRTGAVTEYLDFGFNAFAKSGANTYLGAADDGLYELVGPDDAGQPIVADIIGGVADFGGTFLSSMKAAYLGIRGTGEFYLKLTAGDGRSYTYAVKSRNLQTTRVDIGKGLRATYFTWELVSSGQDFDLLGVTFLPIQQTRRV